MQLSVVLPAEQKHPLSIEIPPVDHEVPELSVLHIGLSSSKFDASILGILGYVVVEILFSMGGMAIPKEGVNKLAKLLVFGGIRWETLSPCLEMPVSFEP